MSDLSITAANVIPASTPSPSIAGNPLSDFWGEAVTRGEVVYRDNVTKKLFKAKADTSAHAGVVGIALADGANGQPAIWQSGGTLAIGTGTAGTVYVVSGANFGGIAPWADLSSTQYVSIVAIADASSNLLLCINPTGIQHA